MEFMELLSWIGRTGIAWLWIPLGVWTLAAIPMLLGSRRLARGNPLVHYHGTLALLASLPIGFLLMPVALQVSPGTLGIESIPSILDAPAAPLPIDETASAVLLEEGTAWDVFAALGMLTVLALLFSAYQLGRLLYLLRSLRRVGLASTSAASPALIAHARVIAAELQMPYPVSIVLRAGEQSPMTFGWWRPIIVLPEGLVHEPSTLRTVLTHELVHIKRHDYRWALLARFIAALFSFNPIVGWVGRHVHQLREMACDQETLIRTAESPSAYARLLLRFQPSRQQGLALSMASNRSTLKKRIEAMPHHASSSTMKRSFRQMALVATFLILPTLLIACSTDTKEEPALSLQGNVEVLEVQLNYLEGRITEILAEMDALNEEHAGYESAADVPVSLRKEIGYANERYSLVSSMHTRTMSQLEYARMEAATERLIDRPVTVVKRPAN